MSSARYVTYKVLTTSEPTLITRFLFVVQHSFARLSTASLARPPSSSSKINNRSFPHASPSIWKQLPYSLRHPLANQFPLHLPLSVHAYPFFCFIITTLITSRYRNSSTPGLKLTCRTNPFHKSTIDCLHHWPNWLRWLWLFCGFPFIIHFYHSPSGVLMFSVVSVCLYVCMSVCLSVCLSVCMYVCMSACNTTTFESLIFWSAGTSSGVRAHFLYESHRVKVKVTWTKKRENLCSRNIKVYWALGPVL